MSIAYIIKHLYLKLKIVETERIKCNLILVGDETSYIDACSIVLHLSAQTLPSFFFTHGIFFLQFFNIFL